MLTCFVIWLWCYSWKNDVRSHCYLNTKGSLWKYLNTGYYFESMLVTNVNYVDCLWSYASFFFFTWKVVLLSGKYNSVLWFSRNKNMLSFVISGTKFAHLENTKTVSCGFENYYPEIFLEMIFDVLFSFYKAFNDFKVYEGRTSRILEVICFIGFYILKRFLHYCWFSTFELYWESS